jgi:hypothetical protein
MHRNRSANGVVGGALSAFGVALICQGGSLQAGVDPSLRKDPHYRDEWGVNAFTAPSIADVFQDLDALKPIPIAKVERMPEALTTDDRARYALSLGVLIADGFLAVERQDSKSIDLLGHELLRRAKGLGVAQRLSQHGQRLLENAKRGRWEQLRQELIFTQRDVENAMLDLRDEQIAHLLSLGGWVRGLEIAAACVAETYSAERAKLLKKLDLLDYYLARLQELSPRSRKRPLIASLTQHLQEIRSILDRNEPISQADASSLYIIVRNTVGEIEGQTAANETAGHQR